MSLSPPDSVIPTLAVTNTSPSTSATGRDVAWISRSAIISAVSSVGTLGHSTVNSSPPKRATMSDGRIAPLSRSATATSSRSPAECPRLSFTTLKRSRSRKSTATRSWLTAAARELALEPLDEQRAVGQAGERVVDGLVRERGAARAALGDVFHLAHEVERRALQVAHERHAHRDPHRVAVVMQVALLELQCSAPRPTGGSASTRAGRGGRRGA